MNFWATLCILFLSSLLADGLRCYKCIRFNCPHDVEKCKHLQMEVIQKARLYFHISSSQLSTCPDPNPESPTFQAWSIMEGERESECPGGRNRHSACTASRFEIHPNYIRNLTTGKRLQGDVAQVSYGTILGCPTAAQTKVFQNKIGGSQCVLSPPETLNSLTSSIFQMQPTQNQIQNQNQNQPQPQSQGQNQQKIEQQLVFEHCTTNDCNFADFCYNKFLSVPRKFKLSDDSGVYSLWIAIGILALTLGIICVYIFAEFCRADEQRAIAIGGSDNIMENYQNVFRFQRKKKRVLIESHEEINDE